METRRLIIAFLAAMATYMLWVTVAPHVLPRSWQQPAPSVTTAPAESRPAFAETQPSAEPTSTRPAEMRAEASGTQPAPIRLDEGSSTDPILLGSTARDKMFPMEIQIQPRGASISRVKLREHYETVKKDKPYTIIEPVTTEDGSELRAFTTSKIRFESLKLDVPLDRAIWQMEVGADGQSVSGRLDIRTEQGEPLARVIKQYRLPTQPLGSGRFDLDLTLKVENLSNQPIRIILVQQGPVGFRREDLRAEDRTVVGGVWDGQSVKAKGHLRAEVIKKGKIELGADQGDSRIAWAAEANRYFTCIMHPTGRTGPSDEARFAGIEAIDIGDTATAAEPEESSALTFQYVTTPRDIPAGGTETVAFGCYIGPKSKKAFDAVPQYSQLDYYAVIRQGFYMCAPAGLTSIMMRLLDWFHAVPPRNYGVAIIILVLVVRGLLHPITKKSQVNMMKMQKQMSVLQPKIEAVKKKYANDRAQLNQEIMKVYQEAGVNPAGNLLTCLPLMLQIPIWGALWAALSSTIEMRHAPFDGWWIRDLTSPDAVITFSHRYHIPLLSSMMGGPLMSLNILPILLGISQVLQTKYMPRGAPAGQTGGAPDQLEQQRKMMMIMSGVFVLFLYNAPSGLNLYIMASNFFGILEQWRIRKHIAEEEKRMKDRGTEEPPEAGGSSVAKRPPGGPATPRKESWLERKWKELQKQADEARRIQSQREKKPRSSR